MNPDVSGGSTGPADEGRGFLESLQRAFARQPVHSPGRFVPLGPTVAVSREAGSRGGSIARSVAKKLAWDFFDQEFLEYLAQEKHLAKELFDALDESAVAWVDDNLHRLPIHPDLGERGSIVDVARVILAIGARGKAVILGRGAGCILPPESTLFVRVVAPLADRIVYLSQFERRTAEDAARQVRLRDESRTRFVETYFGRSPDELHQYGLVLNSSALGAELSAELIVRAAQAKAARGGDGNKGEPLATVPEPIQ